MNILTILGSPRKNGNTAEVLGRFEELVAPRHHVERANLVDNPTHGCFGCNACQRVADKPGCVQRDATAALIDRIVAADVIVFASPLYCWSFSAQMKAMMDREYCLVKHAADGATRSLLQGKRTALLVTCAGPEENNADLIQAEFDRQMEYLQGTAIGKYVVPLRAAPQMVPDRVETVAQQMAWDLDGAAGWSPPG